MTWCGFHSWRTVLMETLNPKPSHYCALVKLRRQRIAQWAYGIAEDSR